MWHVGGHAINLQIAQINAGLLFVFAMMSLGVYGVILSGFASNNNYVRGQTTPNFVAARADSNGDLCFFTVASAHLIWDQVAELTELPSHNALRLLDTVVQLSVLDRDLTAPPASPADGDRYIVASGATGFWAGWDLNVATWVDGVWMRLVPARVGWPGSRTRPQPPYGPARSGS